MAMDIVLGVLGMKKTITLRVPKEKLAIIDKAASLLGITRTQFLTESALKEAREMACGSYEIRWKKIND